MFKPTLFFAKALLAASALLFAAEPSFAQHRGGGGGRGGGWHGGGGGYGGGGWHGGGWRGGGWYGGIGLGWGSPYLYGGYGGWGYPDYGNYGTDYYGGYPTYGYSTPYYQDNAVIPSTGYQSFYPPMMTTQSDNTATIEVRVPPDAELWFDGTKTNQRGPVRYFTTPPLTPGQTFTYEIRASGMANGNPMDQTRQVQVQAGKRTTVDFTTGG